MEKDCSDEATTLVDRTSRAIMHTDKRSQPKLHKGDDESSDDEIKYQDLCPSWMGMVFQV